MTDNTNSAQNPFPTAGCPGKTELPTPKEREALDAMRLIKEHVREIKKELRFLKSPATEKDDKKIFQLEKRLAGLKKDWDTWEKRWGEAVRERMIYLGHEDP